MRLILLAVFAPHFLSHYPISANSNPETDRQKGAFLSAPSGDNKEKMDPTGSCLEVEKARITVAEQKLLAKNYRLVQELGERIQWVEDCVCPWRRPPSFMMRHQAPLDFYLLFIAAMRLKETKL
jgi:hypothetical protein